MMEIKGIEDEDNRRAGGLLGWRKEQAHKIFLVVKWRNEEEKERGGWFDDDENLFCMSFDWVQNEAAYTISYNKIFLWIN